MIKYRKKVLLFIGILVLSVLVVLAYLKYQSYKTEKQIAQANIRTERIAKKQFLRLFDRDISRDYLDAGYNGDIEDTFLKPVDYYYRKYVSSNYDDKYWDLFLKDKEVIRNINLFNQYMYDNHADSPYTSLTIEALKSDQLAELADFWYFDVGNYFEDNGEMTFDEAMDLAIRGGREKDIINMLGYTELTVQYDYATTYEEVFLKEENLGGFIDSFNLYVKQNYPDLTYDQITVEVLVEYEYDSYLELWNLTDELKQRGVELSDIVAQIHQEMDAANP